MNDHLESVRGLVETGRLHVALSSPVWAIPVHPQPGFYETTRGVDPKTGKRSVTPQRIERILARPRWTLTRAKAAADRAIAAKRRGA